MMSLFSSFDALCAESTGWKKSFSFSPASVPGLCKDEGLKRESSNQQAENRVGAEENKAAAVAMAAKKKIAVRNPRFAVELDGLHCFETILPY